MNRLRSLAGRAALLMVVFATVVTGCIPGGGTEPSSLRIIVPTSPGGGFDQTARLTAIAMERAGLVERASIINMPGDGGLAAVHRTRLEAGEPALLLQMGLATLSNVLVAGQDDVLDELTPVALLIEEPGAIMVRDDSEFQTIADLTAALQNDPEIVIGGGSQPGGPDYLAAMLLVDSLGLDPAEVDYRSYDGGGDMLGALVTERVDVAFSGVAEHLYEIRAGEVRVLAVTGANRLDGVDAPTLLESGYDIEFHNWRGVMAPPDVSREQRAALVTKLEGLHNSQPWRDLVAENLWVSSFYTGDDFASRIADEKENLRQLLERFPPSSMQ